MRRGIFASAALVALGLAGCQTVGLTASPALPNAGFSYQGGTASQSFPFPADQVQAALVEAMADLKMRSAGPTQEEHGTSFHGQTADNRKVTVTLSRVLGAAAIVSGSSVDTTPPKDTSAIVTVRVGWLGDEPLSRFLMDRIGIRLGTTAPAAIPSEPPSSPERPVIFGGREVGPPSVRRMNDAGYRDTPVP
jgi:hypothetical protein